MAADRSTSPHDITNTQFRLLHRAQFDKSKFIKKHLINTFGVRNRYFLHFFFFFSYISWPWKIHLHSDFTWIPSLFGVAHRTQWNSSFKNSLFFSLAWQRERRRRREKAFEENGNLPLFDKWSLDAQRSRSRKRRRRWREMRKFLLKMKIVGRFRMRIEKCSTSLIFIIVLLACPMLFLLHLCVCVCAPSLSPGAKFPKQKIHTISVNCEHTGRGRGTGEEGEVVSNGIDTIIIYNNTKMEMKTKPMIAVYGLCMNFEFLSVRWCCEVLRVRRNRKMDPKTYYI